MPRLKLSRKIGPDPERALFESGFWCMTGEDENGESDASRLIYSTSLQILGVEHHIEACRLDPQNDTDIQSFAEYDDSIDAIMAGVGADGPWETVTINNERYVLVITPYCR